MAKGRIPGNTPEQALMIVNKGIEYEKNPVDDAGFYQNGLNCAQFQDKAKSSSKPDGYAARRFCHTSEEIRDYLISLGYNISRVYQTDEGNNPKRYNNGYYSKGQKIPDELLRSNGFKWDGGAEDIINEINKGKFYVLHRDHGYRGGAGWAHPKFLAQDINRLENGKKQPIVFSMNCHTGEFRLGDSFAEAFLRKKNGGAVGVVAAAYYSLSGYNDGLTAGMFDAIWSSPGLKPNFGSGGRNGGNVAGHESNVRAMGDVLNQGLIRMRENWTGDNNGTNKTYTHRLFHFFGDAALKIWIKKPEQITATYSKSLSCGATSLEIKDISIDNGTATLVQGDSLIACVNFTTNSISLNFNSVNDTLPLLLTLSAIDSKPLVEEIDITGCTNLPKPAFMASNYSVVDGPGNRVYFTNQTTNTADSYEWTISPSTFNYIDGTGATAENPVVHFTAAGKYTVSLKATNINGSRTETRNDIISVRNSVGATNCKPGSFNLKSIKMCGIYHFQMNEINKVSSGTAIDDDGSNGGYMDFTNEMATLKKDQKVDFKVTVGEREEHFAMFIDYNNDGEFDNGTERVVDYENIHMVHKGSFMVIPNPPAGMVRMRIITDYKDFSIANACYSPRYGQVEDYTVRFVNVEPESEPGQLKELSYASASMGVRLIYNGGDENTEYGLVYSTDPDLDMGNWTKVGSSVKDKEATINLTSLTENTTYYVKSYATNEVGTVYSGKIVEFTTHINGAPTNYPTNLRNSGLAGTGAKLEWDDSKGGTLPAGYLIKWSTEGYDKIVAPLDGVQEPESNSIAIVEYGAGEILLSGLLPETTYYFEVYPYVNNGADIKYKKDGTVPQMELTTISAGAYGPVSFVSPVNLVSVKFNTIENAEDRGGLGYIDYTPKYETTVERGQTYDITVETNQTNQTAYYHAAWIDWNQNNLFESSEKTYLGILKGAMTKTKTVTVPASAKGGATTMRLMYAQKSTASPYNPVKSDYGSVEEYKIIIDAVPGLWKGTFSSAWEDAQNWDNELLPDNNVDVVVQNGVVNYPVIRSATTVKSIKVQDGASLIIAEGTDLTVSENVTLKSGGKLNVKNGKTAIAGNLNVGDNGQGELTVEGGVLNITGDMYTGTNQSRVNISGGSVALRNWKKDAGNEWTEGTCHFSGGEIDFNSLKFTNSTASKVVVDGPFSMVVRGYLCNNKKNWTFTDGNLIFRGDKEAWFGCAGLNETAVANNVIVENTERVYFTRHESNRNAYFKIQGDFVIKGKAAGVYKGKSNKSMTINGDFIVGPGAEFNLGDVEPILMKNLIAEGKLIADDSELKFHGSTEQSISCNQIIERLVVDNDAGGVRMASDIMINDKLILRGGVLKLNGQNFTVLEDAYIEDADELGYPDAIITDKGGEVRKVMKTTGLKDFFIPFAYADKDFPVVADISNVTPSGKYVAFSVTGKADESVAENTSLNRRWEINTEEGFGEIKVDARLTYLDEDLGNLDETKLIPAMKSAVWESCGSAVADENKLSVTTTQTGVISALVRPVLDYTINFENETTGENVASGVNYSENADFSGAKVGEDKVVELAPGTNLYFRQPASESSLATENDFVLDVPDRPEKPEEITIDFITETSAETVPEAVEYSTDNFATSVQGTDKAIKLVPSRNVSFRYKATSTEFKSEASGLIVPARPETPTVPVVNDVENTFGFTFNPNYTEFSDYEVSLDGGGQWDIAEASFVEVGNVDLEAGAVRVRIRASNDAEKARFRSDVLVSTERFTLLTSTENVFKDKRSIYPNPSEGKVFVDLNGTHVDELTVAVFNASGQSVVHYEEGNLLNPEIDLSGFEKGLYYIQLVSDKFNVTEKVIIR